MVVYDCKNKRNYIILVWFDDNLIRQLILEAYSKFRIIWSYKDAYSGWDGEGRHPKTWQAQDCRPHHEVKETSTIVMFHSFQIL